MDGNKLSRFSISFVLILLLISVVSAIPPLPAEFYGSVHMNGNPAPAGTTISATIGGEVRGTFTLTEAGVYGGSGLFDDRLVVSATEDDVALGSAQVMFLLGNTLASQIAELMPGTSQQLDLSVGGGAVPTTSPTIVPTSVPTQIPTPVPTVATPVPTAVPTTVVTQPVQSGQAPIADFTSDVVSGSKPLTVVFTDLSTGSSTDDAVALSAQNEVKYLWTFGDGTTSTEKNPTHIYQKAGIFDVSLTISSAIGSDQKVEMRYIIVTGDIPPPAAMFEATPLAGSAPLKVMFTDISIGPPTAWLWDFGDGKTSTERNPTYVYTTPGSYSVSLWIENAGGSNSVTRNDYIFVPGSGSSISADFTGAPTSGTVPLTVRFRDLSVENPTMWNWDFGDGQTSMVANPEHTYTTPGVHTVTLTVSSQTGSDTKQKTAYITANNNIVGLIASFSAYPTGGTAPLSVEFKDTSIGNPTMWYWEFGDGQTATIANPKHVYTSPGTYTVKLTVSNQVATQTATIENAIVVLGGSSDFTADFVASPTSGVMPLTVQFTDISSGSPARWVWDFGDGAISTEQHPRHVYKNAGSYSVRFRVTDAAGFVHETRKQGFINIQAAQTGSHGRVEITFAPDRAAIILNGKKVGEAEYLKTYTIPSVPPGIHQLRITKGGFEDFNREITVLPGKATKVQGRMTQTSTMGGTLSVSTSPDGANVFLDGQPLGTAPIWKPSVSVGSHTISVTAGNYYDWAREIYVTSGEVSYLTAVLYPQWWSQDTGIVMASSLLGEGTVFIDGVSIGQSPITVSNLEAGIHTIRIETPNHKPWEDTVTVYKGRTSYVVAAVD